MSPQSEWPIPQFNLRIEDLSAEGVPVFLDSVHPTQALSEAMTQCFQWLYTLETVPTHVEVITLVLKNMDGVAFTFGSNTHKEIHFSLKHIKNCESRAKHEIMGVLVHELVHCIQYNGCKTCPGGLVEGIADFIRLKSDYSPPHWKRSPGDKWDAGYEKTGFFLNWMENRYGEGTVRELNLAMNGVEYHRRIFKDVTGRPLRKLWKIYCDSFGEGEPSETTPHPSVPTHPTTEGSVERDSFLEDWEEV